MGQGTLNRSIADKFELNGNVRKNVSIVGQVNEDGTVHKNGSIIG